MRKDLFKIRLLSLTALCGIAIALASCSSEENVQGGNKGSENGEDKNLTAFMAGAPESRTSMDYTTGDFFWEAGDKIYVKDDDGYWRASSNAPTAKTASFKFKVPGKFAAQTSYKVYYSGKNGNRNEVRIQASQKQGIPNTTTHFGESGDCGTATATKATDKAQFEFTLDHQAAYLVFQPYTSNAILKNCYLTKIEVNSDNDIAGNYTLDLNTGELTGTTYDKQIVLWTSDKYDSSKKGFTLTNTAASLATNGAYMVIKPGTHALKIRYWVKDYATNVEGTITKTFSAFNYVKNTYYDMTALLDARDYDGDHYYQWDAQDQYWKGYEWNKGGDQPTLTEGAPGATTSENYPRWKPFTSDSRLAHQGTSQATQSCANVPNANEISWYLQKGDHHIDKDEVWTTMGHLYKGGMWLLKRSKISGFRNDLDAFGNDQRANGTNQGLPGGVNLTPLEPATAGNYFFLPFLGYYDGNKLRYAGEMGFYWTANANMIVSGNACGLSFSATQVIMTNGNVRSAGFRAQPFSYFGDN